MKLPTVVIKKHGAGLSIYFDTYCRNLLELKEGMKYEVHKIDDGLKLKEKKGDG